MTPFKFVLEISLVNLSPSEVVNHLGLKPFIQLEIFRVDQKQEDFDWMKG